MGSRFLLRQGGGLRHTERMLIDDNAVLTEICRQDI